jgi:hypothetical protein
MLNLRRAIFSEVRHEQPVRQSKSVAFLGRGKTWWGQTILEPTWIKEHAHERRDNQSREGGHDEYDQS